MFRRLRLSRARMPENDLRGFVLLFRTQWLDPLTILSAVEITRPCTGYPVSHRTFRFRGPAAWAGENAIC